MLFSSCVSRFKVLIATLAIAILGIAVFSASPALAKTSDLRETLELNSSFKDTSILRDDDDLIAGCAGEIRNGSGELECEMPFGNYWARIQAATGYNNGISGMVECYIKFPNGTTQQLGFIPASNGATPEVDFYFCPIGIYKFIFLASTNETLDVAGFIYD